jgi:hypothetical protein
MIDVDVGLQKFLDDRHMTPIRCPDQASAVVAIRAMHICAVRQHQP